MNFIVAPFAWLLRVFYGLVHNYGVSIILFGIVVKLVTLPFQMKSKKSMVRMGRLTGKQQELQKQYANNQQKYNEELQKLYMEEGINPMGGCLWSFLPLFLLIPLYQIIYRPISVFMGLSNELMTTLMDAAKGMGFDPSTYNTIYEQIGLSNFIHDHWSQFSQYAGEGLIDVNFNFLGLNLSSIPRQQFSVLKDGGLSWGVIGLLLIPIVSAGLQYISTKVMTKSNGQDQQQQGSMRMMNIFMLAMSLYWTFIMPAAMGLYWTINTVLMMIQEFLLGKFYTNKLNAEEDEKEAKKRAARKMKMEAAQKRMEEWEAEKEKSKPKAKRQTKAQQKPAGEKKNTTNEAGRLGERPYARGRSYQADRYEEKE